jgi:GT2 family glycosyltransferase/glycosyltransferase involved in cell wall biosynthesis
MTMGLLSFFFGHATTFALPSEFDESEYLRSNPDVAAAVGRREWKSGAAHWMYLGKYEGRLFRAEPDESRLPSDFNESAYLRMYPEVAEAVAQGQFDSGAAHWLRHGQSEGRVYSDLPLDFDEEIYLRAHSDVAAAVAARSFESGASHWLSCGRIEGRRSWARVVREQLPVDFDEAAYLRLNPTVAAMVARGQLESGASHWLMRGRHVGALWNADTSRVHASSREGFQSELYAKFYPDLGAHLGHDPELLLQHWRLHGFREGRIPFGLCPYQSRRMTGNFLKRRNAITFYGLFDEPTGLGSSARGYRSALLDAGYEVTSITISIKARSFETTPDVRSDSTPAAVNSSRRNKVNIFHINADMAHNFFLDRRLHLLDDSFNIGIWFWELAHFRPDWASAFGAFDEIWVSSEFCRAAISSISPVPVVTIPLSVEIDRTAAVLPRSFFRLPDDVFIFGCIFDVGSVVERKNPEAAVRAFIAAFGDRRDVLLVLKYHSAHHYPAPIQELHALVAGHDNIRIYGRSFERAEIISFKSVIDCYVSPHRSEGFGLNIAEALLLEKPVITTNYSGNADFTDRDDSYPIDYRLVELENDLGPYPAEALWADPDVEHLAFQMRTVLEDRWEAKRRAQAGRNRILRDYSKAAIGARLKDHFDELEIFAPNKDVFRSTRSAKHYTYRYIEPVEPKISVVVPVYNIDPLLLIKCIESVIRQTYDNWELILHDDGSNRSDTLDALERYRGVDTRIKLSFGTKNSGISEATNAAIGLSSGSFIAFLDNDDELAPDALTQMAATIKLNENADLLYSDEDKIDPHGNYCDHYFKPDWSPEHLESVMYLLHFLVVRRSTLLAVGGLRARFDGAQDYDLALRVTRVARQVVHVPKVLYHWRQIPGSAAAQVDAKPIGLQRAGGALQDHLNAAGREAIVVPGMAPGLFRVRDKLPEKLKVTLVIFTDNRTATVPGRGEINLFDHFVASILARTTTACDLRILAIDNGNLSPEQRELLESNSGTIVSYPEPRSAPFNFSKKANFALKHVKTELVILLNDDMEVISPDWVDALVELAMRPSSGLVGARLLYPDDRIQHCGVVLGINEQVAHIYHQWPAAQIGYNGYTHIIRNYLAVTGACIAARMSIFDEVGGFDETLKVDYNDIDLCLRVHVAGYRNIYTPFATLYHFEGVTQTRSSANEEERRIFTERWAEFMKCDPYYNPNLSRKRLDFAVET